MKTNKIIRVAIALSINFMLVASQSVGAVSIGNDVEFIPFPQNLGIGNDHPDRKLVVNGTAAISGDGIAGNDDLLINGQIKITGGSPVLGNVLTSDATGLASWQPVSSSTRASILSRAGSTDTEALIDVNGNLQMAMGNELIFAANGTDAGDIKFLNAAGGEQARIYTDPNDIDTIVFSVGSSEPEVKISKDGNIEMIKGNEIRFIGNGDDAGDLVFLNEAGNEKARIYSDTNARNGLAFSIGAASPEVYLNELGNLGVNTLTPTEKLEVGGNVKATGFIGDGSGLTNIPSGAISGTTRASILSRSGSTDTEALVDVNGNLQMVMGNELIFAANGTDAGDIKFMNAAGGEQARIYTDPNDIDTIVFSVGSSEPEVKISKDGNIEMIKGNEIRFIGNGDDAGDLVFLNEAGNEKARIYSDTNARNGLAFSIGAASPEVYLNELGNLGVNTLTPTEKLEVGGNVKATGFIGDGSGLTNIPAGAINGTTRASILSRTGSTATEASVDVNGNLQMAMGNELIFAANGTDAGDIKFLNAAGGEQARIYTDPNTVDNLVFSVGSSEPEMLLDQNGNLHMMMGNEIAFFANGTDAGELKFMNAAGGEQARIYTDPSDIDTLIFSVGSYEPEVKISKDGNLEMIKGNEIRFIGNGDDAGDIVFLNEAGNEKARIYSDTNARNGLAFSIGAASPEVYLNELGNLGVGNVVPTQKVDVTGIVKADGFLTSGAITGTGTINAVTPIRAVVTIGAGPGIRATATCAADEYLVSGGAKCQDNGDGTVTGTLKENYPDAANGWTGMCTPDAAAVTVSAICFKKYLQLSP